MEVVRSSESSAASNPSPDGNQPLHRQHDVDRDGDLDGGDDDEGERGHRRMISIERWIILEFGVSQSVPECDYMLRSKKLLVNILDSRSPMTSLLNLAIYKII